MPPCYRSKLASHNQQLSRYERGENKINVAHLVEIAAALNTEISWFFIDCISDQKINDKQKFIPVSEDRIRNRLYAHLDRLSADKKTWSFSLP